MKVWFQNRRMKWRHQESKERREGRLEGEAGPGAWLASTACFEDEEDLHSEDEDAGAGAGAGSPGPVLADSTVDKDGLL